MGNNRWSLKGLYRYRMQELLKVNYGIRLPVIEYQKAKWYDQSFLKEFLFTIDWCMHNDTNNDELYNSISKNVKHYFEEYPEKGLVMDEDALAIAMLVNKRKQYYDIIRLWTRWFIHHKGTDGLAIFEPSERKMLIEQVGKLKEMDTYKMAEFFAWLWD